MSAVGNFNQTLSKTMRIYNRQPEEVAPIGSEACCSNIYDRAAVGVVYVTLSGTILCCNPRYCQLLGYQLNELSGRNVTDITHPEDQAQHFHWMQKLVSREISHFSMEKRYFHKNGGYLWCKVTTSLLQDSRGEPQYTVVLVEDISDRKYAEAKLYESEQRFLIFAEQTLQLLYDLNILTGQIQWAGASEQITGYSKTEMESIDLATREELIHPDDREAALALLSVSLEQHIPYQVEYRFRCKDGSYIYLEDRGVFLELEQPHMLGVMRDISERKLAEAALRQSEAKFRLLAENMRDLVGLHDEEGNYLYLSPSVHFLLGYQPEELLGQSFYQFIHREDCDRVRANFEPSALRDSLVPITYRMRRKWGNYIWLEMLVKPIQDGSGSRQWQTTSRDITEKVQIQQQLEHKALYDSLTGLPNRSVLKEHLERAIERSHAPKACPCAVLFLDIDRFKLVNDSLGHVAGDCLLVEIAYLLQSCIGDRDLVTRLGGDEFIILLQEVADLKAAIRVAELILQKFDDPIRLIGYEFAVSASIGIVLGTSAYDRASELIRDADTAMYQAKEKGGSCYQVFDPVVQMQAAERLQLENDLRKAIANQEFQLYYQPIISIDTGALKGFEALLRWQHPQKGWIPPDKFIEIAEETRAIIPIGSWVMETACRQLKTWQNRFPDLELTMSANVSAVQLQSWDFLQQVDEILARTGLNGRYLVLEITESMAIGDRDTYPLFKALEQRGIRIAIDDFGTGYSCLSYLHRFPIATLKIDKSFTACLLDNR